MQDITKDSSISDPEIQLLYEDIALLENKLNNVKQYQINFRLQIKNIWDFAYKLENELNEIKAQQNLQNVK